MCLSTEKKQNYIAKRQSNIEAIGKNVQLKINYFKKNRDFFVVFVVLCVSCSCILGLYGDKIVGFSYRPIMPCRRQFD